MGTNHLIRPVPGAVASVPESDEQWPPTGIEIGRPEPGEDAAIGEDVDEMLYDLRSTRLPGEQFTFDVEVSDGAVTITGGTDSVMLYRKLSELVPRLKAVNGVKSVDVSGFSRP